MRLHHVFSVLAVSAILTGCSTLSPRREPLYVDGNQPRQIDVVAYLECITTAGHRCSAPTTPDSTWPSRERAIRRLEVNLPPEQLPAERNRLIRALIANSDHNCNLFLDNIRTSRRTIRGGLSMTARLTASAASLLDPGSTPTILSGISAASQESSTIFQSDIFSALGTDVVYSAIREARSEDLHKVTMYLSDSYAPGSLSEALGAIERYDSLCSFKTAEDRARETLAQIDRQTRENTSAAQSTSLRDQAGENIPRDGQADSAGTSRGLAPAPVTDE